VIVINVRKSFIKAAMLQLSHHSHNIPVEGEELDLGVDLHFLEGEATYVYSTASFVIVMF